MNIKVTVDGVNVLRDSLLNKGTAFTDAEKDTFHLHGLLPYHTENLQEQLVRIRAAFMEKTSPLEKHIYLRALQDRNEVLYYRFIVENIEEMLPLIYTPVVGDACQLFHHIYRQSRGLFLNYPDRRRLDSIFSSIAQYRTIKVIVVTDGERILGLGDQGVGGLGIPIGKLAIYTACGGIEPGHTLPIILDVGTNNQERLDDPQYMGWRHARITGQDYFDFVDHSVQMVKRYFPDALLQFEDFAQQHAYPLLTKYRDQLCTFNDDIQGTAAIVVSCILAASQVAEVPLKDQRIAVLGAGSAGCGISEQLVQAMINQGLSDDEARRRFYLVDQHGLIHDGLNDLLPFQQRLAQKKADIAGWVLQNPAGPITLYDVIHHAKPAILLGVSGQPNQFTEPMVNMMASYSKHPIIFPLSNPTSRAEAHPQDLLAWTNGTGIIATGSPFDAVVMHGQTITITQCNNAYIFPGLGLAVVATKAKRVSDRMMMAAAVALSRLAQVKETQGRDGLLPPLAKIREVSQVIAKAVVVEAIAEGHVDPMPEAAIDALLRETFWTPEYQTFIR